MIVNCNRLKMFTIKSDTTHQQNNREKAVRCVSIAQREFDMCNVTDFAELITVLKQFLASNLNINSVIMQIRKNQDEIAVIHDDMESSLPRSYPPFHERDHFYLDRFNTSLSYVQVPSHYAEAKIKIKERSKLQHVI
jgi:hypothetical protein